MCALLLLEHVNLVVPDLELAERFYIKSLGGRSNPRMAGTDLLHVNVGLSQMHLPKGKVRNGKLEPAQVMDGFVELISEEPLAMIADRVSQHFGAGSGVSDHQVQCKLGTAKETGFIEEVGERAREQLLRVTCPWGNLFYISRATAQEVAKVCAAGGHMGGSGSLIGLRTVRARVQQGTAQSLVTFYKHVLDCDARLGQLRDKRAVCRVPFDSGAEDVFKQSLVFEEQLSQGGDHCIGKPNDYDGCEAKQWHVAIYLRDQSAFETAFLQASQRSIVYVNPRFQGGPIEFASSETLAEARESSQFRLKDLIAGVQLEHEVRSPHHVSFPLGRKNITADQTTSHL